MCCAFVAYVYFGVTVGRFPHIYNYWFS